jgi:5-methylcytosine-specific restriction endonuclease McrA
MVVAVVSGIAVKSGFGFWIVVLGVVTVIAANSRLPRRCLLCGTRGKHTCILIPDLTSRSRGVVHGVLRDPGLRQQETTDVVWKCTHWHGTGHRGRRYTYGAPRWARIAGMRCARTHLRRLQLGLARPRYPFRLKFDPRHRYQPGLRGILPKDESARMVIQANSRCFYCGVITEQLEADHVIPVSRGGSSMPWNLVVACRDCNRRKSSRTGWEFIPIPTPERRARLTEIDERIRTGVTITHKEWSRLAGVKRTRGSASWAARSTTSRESASAQRDEQREMRARFMRAIRRRPQDSH